MDRLDITLRLRLTGVLASYSTNSLSLHQLFQVLDFSQYYLDLSEANSKNEAVWQLEYNLTSYYGLNELSPRSLHELAQSFTLSNSLLFER